jgi:hypothetical protein
MAPKLVQYNAVLVRDGVRLGFWNLSGSKGTEPPDWPVRDSGVGECNQMFICMRLRELIDAVRAAV